MVRRAFSLIEVLVVVVILGILAAVVVPRFAGASEDARSTALESALGAVRSSIATYRSRAVIQGQPAYPDLNELRTPGGVMQQGLPRNPLNDLTALQAVSQAQAEARAVLSPGAFGWNYFFDNSADPPIAIFYANSDEPTTIPDGAGGFAPANDL